MFTISAVLSILGSFILVSVLIPKISWIVKSRNLIHDPNIRSSHEDSIPAMAGVSFFLSLIFIMILIKPWDTNGISLNLIAAVGLMFAIGLKDDLVMSTPRAKVLGEVLAIFFVLFCECLEVKTLNGFLGINEIHFLVSYVFIILLLLILINSYNLIDGIDGLASSIGIVVFSVYAYLFFIVGLNFYFLLCLCFVGMLLAYLRFNMSKVKKVFMGDTGSLIIGFCIGFVSLKFLSLDATVLELNGFKAENAIILIIAIFFIPLFDTFRVIGVRMMNGKSPFYPDNNHIHHILINLGLTHFKASLILSFSNLLFAVGIILLSKLFNNFWMLGIIAFSFLSLLLLFHRLKKSNKVIEN